MYPQVVDYLIVNLTLETRADAVTVGQQLLEKGAFFFFLIVVLNLPQVLFDQQHLARHFQILLLCTQPLFNSCTLVSETLNYTVQ